MQTENSNFLWPLHIGVGKDGVCFAVDLHLGELIFIASIIS